jgi:hypothetical protein
MTISAKPRKGDRVELTEDYGIREKGQQGVVVSTQRNLHSELLVEVELDLGGSITCFYYRLKVISPVPVEPQAAKEIPTDLITMVKNVSVRVGTRNVDAIFKSLVEEVGELSTELSIEAGTKKRQPSPDGVVGEAIDVLVVILDLLHLKLGNDITGQAFLDRVQSKLNKWEAGASVREGKA